MSLSNVTMAKKSLIVKPKIYDKVDEVFHKLFFEKKVDFDNSGIEIIVNETTESSPKVIKPFLFQQSLFERQAIQATPQDRYKHKFRTRGRYLKVGIKEEKPLRHNAFTAIDDEIVWDHDQPLLKDYTGKIARELCKSNYACSDSDGVLTVRSAVSKNEIKRAIRSYIGNKGGYLTKREFINLTGASEFDLIRLFGLQHDTIANRQYSIHDVLGYSQKFTFIFEEKIVGRATFPKTKYNPNANIMNIYRKIVDGDTKVKDTSTRELIYQPSAAK